MLPKKHIFLGAIFSLFAYLLFPQIGLYGAITVFLSSIFIDIDHYIWFVKNKKSFSLRLAYNWHKNNQERITFMHVLHTFEFHLFLLAMSYFNIYIFYILLGFLFHSALDIIDMYRTNSLGCREYFFVRWLIKKI